MKKTVLLLICLSFGILKLTAQNNLTPCKIVLKNGTSINAYHFGQKDCSSKSYFEKYILIKGKYEGQVTEIKNYNDIAKIELRDFTEDPIVTGENETGDIAIYKTNGVAVTLKDASISLACYGLNELKNQLRVQMQNPINNSIFDKPIDTKDINYILFE